jgi:P-type Ca2+ transporter type 2C
MNGNSMPYNKTWEEVVESLNVAPEQGLSAADAQKRLLEHGPNQLQAHATRGAWAILADQFKSLVVVLLVGAAVLAFALGDITEGVAVLAVIAINAAIGFFTEVKATRSMEALHKMGSVTTRTRRDGRIAEIPAGDLVPGDIVVLEGGDIITADLRVIEASKMECDESALTGESMPVSKEPDALDGDPALADRRNMLYKGTALTRGSGMAVVVATGMDTELGAISSLVAEAEEETTPLEENLNALGRKLVWIVLAITVVVWLMGVLRGKDMFLMLETAIALAVASIPEGLPIVATIALSRGMLRMAQRQALVRRLASVETLGSTSIICTDKTGTLTENKMTVTQVELADGGVALEEGQWTRDGAPVEWAEGAPVTEAFRIGVLCSNAAVQKAEDGSIEAVGDPLEAALLEAGLEAGIDRDELLQRMPEVKEDAFDSVSKMMATHHQDGDHFYVAVKGAPEGVLETCRHVLTSDGEQELSPELRQEWQDRNEELGRDGFRVLGLGRKCVAGTDDDPYDDLVLVGLLGMVDPPRGDIPATIAKCHRAGIRVVMITGDQAPTALNIGMAVGILDTANTEVIHGSELKPFSHLSADEKTRLRNASVFARVSPRQKLDLIALHQEQGATVAMTGDGVNDAPALKKADIGIAMGLRGTQVACQAAHVVLKDDSFKTIVYAIQEGRIIFGNIRKFVMFLLSCNIAEVLVIFLASVMNTPLPITPLQILLLNLVTDVFPALALGVGEGDERVMGHKPRPSDEPLMTRQLWKWVSGYGVVLGLCTLGAFLIAHFALAMSDIEAVTVCFLTLAFGQLCHVFNMREQGSGLFNNEITRNPYVWGAMALCTAILLLAVYVPPLASVLHTTPLGFRGWATVIPMSVAPVAVDVVVRKVRRA